jgi:2Fe-2S ferredoxin
MPQLFVTTRKGEERSVEFEPGSTAMQAIYDANFADILALCGGVCSCATCHIYVDPRFVEALPKMSADENDLLEGSSHRNERSRLSCQFRLTSELDGLRVTIAPED